MSLGRVMGLLGGVALGLVSTVGNRAEAQEATVIYQENYGFCTGSEGPVAADEAGWNAAISGLRAGRIGNMKVFSYGSLTVPAPVNSKPVGLSQGYTFWFKPADGLLTSTREFPFDVRIIKNAAARIQYEQRLNGVDPVQGADASRLALLIDGTWYISQVAVANTNGGISWEGVSWSPSELVYGTVAETPGIAPSLPATFDASLPASGTVQAFGTFMSKVTGRSRFDNFTVSGVVPPDLTVNTAPSESSIEACPATSSDRQGLPPPTPGPDSESEGDDSPTPTPVATPIGGEPTVENISLCPEGERLKGPFVRFTKAALKKMLAAEAAPTAIDLRNAAIVAVLSNKNVRSGNLSNMLVSDYTPATGTVVVPLPNGKVRSVKLGGGAQTALGRYMSTVRSNASAGTPLFLAQQPGTTSIQGTKAACLAEFRRAVRARAKKAKVAAQVTFVTPTRRR